MSARSDTSENRVRLQASVALLLYEFSDLSGRAKCDIASDAIRLYIQQALQARSSSKRNSRKMTSTIADDYWTSRASSLQQELTDLQTHAHMSKRF